MTAAHAVTTHAAKHAAPTRSDVRKAQKLIETAAKAPRTPIAARVAAKLPKRSPKTHLVVVPPSRPITAPKVTGVTNTGKADFVVDSLGGIGRTTLHHTATGYVTVARTAADVAESLYPTTGFASFVDDLFATPEQRARKVNVHAVVQTASLLVPVALKVAKAVAK